jgi:hypothetical protein
MHHKRKEDEKHSKYFWTVGPYIFSRFSYFNSFLDGLGRNQKLLCPNWP